MGVWIQNGTEMLGNTLSKYMDSLKAGIPSFLPVNDGGKQGGSACTIKLITKPIGLFAPALAMLGLLATALPSRAVVTATSYNQDVNTSYYNEYRVCAARLLRVNVSAEAASQACARALRPRDVSLCVVTIQKHTQIPSADALSSCTRARLPRDLASCVVGINRYNKEAVNPMVLTYCGRSLLPVTFAQCVVGLRAEIDFSSTQAMDTCIDASDRVSGFLPTFIPASAGTLPNAVPVIPSVPANTPGVATPDNPGGANPANPGSLTPVNPGSGTR